MQNTENITSTTISMSTYEKWALVLSIIAILIPVFQLVWKRWIQKPILNYYAPSMIKLYFNNSGSYIRIDGSFEAVNKTISVKRIDAKIKHQQDNKELNLEWSAFVSPVNQSIAGAYTSQQEAAHPFHIPSDSIICSFVEFCIKSNSAWRKISPHYNKYTQFCHKCMADNVSYEVFVDRIRQSAEYSNMYTMLMQEFYWDIGNYTVEISVTTANFTKQFIYEFRIDEREYTSLRANIEELMLSPVKDMYKIPRSMQMAETDLR